MMQTYTMQSTRGNALSLPLLTAACKQHWNMDSLPPIAKGQWGKPSFELENHHFNLSHSGGVAICCLSDSPIGVDIQLPRPSRSKFLDKICTPNQRQWLLDFNDSQNAFALLWAMTESYYKYTGRGVPLPFIPVEVPLPQCLPSENQWIHYAVEDVFFSITRLHGGMVSVCGTSIVSNPNINLPIN